MVEDNGFTFPPPSLEGDGYQIPYDQKAVMTLKLITHKIDTALLPEHVKTKIKNDMNILINNASMTNITLGQVREFLGDFDYIWMTYEAYINRAYRKELSYLKPVIRTIFKQNLNKSKDGLYASLVFEQRYRYDVKQRQEQPEEKVRRFFRGKKETREEETR